MSDYKTRKGELLARLEHVKHGPGLYTVEGFETFSFDNRWIVNIPEGHRRFKTFTAALNFISDRIAQPTLKGSDSANNRQRKEKLSRAARKALGSRAMRKAAKGKAAIRNRRKGRAA